MNKQLDLPAAASDAPGTLPILQPDETRELLRAAIDKGGVEAIERIAALYERAQEKQAARAYHDALARFSASVKSIPKTKHVGDVTRKGTGLAYSYAPLEEIARVIADPLKAVGLTYTWDSDVAENKITVTCTVRHVDGHSATAKFTCPIGTNGAISAVQNVASSLTFGRRQSLIQALGLTTCDPDLDGADADVDTGDVITESQSLDLETMIKDTNTNKAKFLIWLKVDEIKNLPASQYAAAVAALKAREKEMEQKARR